MNTSGKTKTKKIKLNIEELTNEWYSLKNKSPYTTFDPY